MKNNNGVDVGYFNEMLRRIYRDIHNYTPEELHTQLTRLARTALTADRSELTDDEIQRAILGVPLTPELVAGKWGIVFARTILAAQAAK